jgi:hypothetical protein
MRTTQCIARTIALLASLAWTATTHAQSAPAAAADGRDTATWRIAAGYDSFQLRDIARSRPPVDASPIAWRGTGPSFFVQRTRADGSRMRRYEASAAFAGNFEYRSPTRSTPRPADDGAWSVDGRYEYRRFVFSTFLPRGLEAGVGVQAIGAISSRQWHIPIELDTRERSLLAGTSIVAAVHVKRWRRVELEADWINGLAIQQLHEEATASPADRSRSAGAWLTNLVVAADVRVGARTALTARLVRTGDGSLGSHGSYASSRSTLVAGVTYGR